MDELFAEIDTPGAVFSPDGTYRYTLTRQWDDGKCVAFLMFNPSVANAFQNDNTVRRCIGFAQRWGYGRLVVLNLYAIRSTDPKAVRWFTDPVGPMNDYWISKSLEESRELICAWGCAQHAQEIEPSIRIDQRVKAVFSLSEVNGCERVCLGYRKDGHPRHPLMLSYKTPREPFSVKFE